MLVIVLLSAFDNKLSGNIIQANVVSQYCLVMLTKLPVIKIIKPFKL